MSVRDTSRMAYIELLQSGVQKTQADYIHEFLEGCSNVNGHTLQEIARLSGIEINAVSGRVNGLKKIGKVVELPKRRCTISGRLVIPVGVPTRKQKELF